MKPSTIYQIARLTPQSKGTDPRRPPGGIPRFTAEDIRLAVSLRTRAVAYHALMAGHCQDQMSEYRMIELISERSSRLYLTKYPSMTISGNINQGIAEAAVLYFMNPHTGRRRGKSGNANIAGVSRGTWARKYHDHWKQLTGYLFVLESEALIDVERAMGY